MTNILSTFCHEHCGEAMTDKKPSVLKAIHDFVYTKDPAFMQQMDALQRLLLMPHAILTSLDSEDH